jgi:hypothetical protein
VAVEADRNCQAPRSAGSAPTLTHSLRWTAPLWWPAEAGPNPFTMLSYPKSRAKGGLVFPAASVCAPWADRSSRSPPGVRLLFAVDGRRVFCRGAIGHHGSSGGYSAG